MGIYILKRILSLLPVLFVVSVVIFGIVHLTPGDPASYMLGEEASPEQVNELREELGLNDPIPVQYLNWLGGVVQGDFGDSYFMNQSVLDAIFSHIGPTLSLAIVAEIIALSISIPIGIVAAIKRGTATDQSVMVVSLMGMAIPSFLLALFLALIFGVQLGWLPVAGYQPLSNGLWNHLQYLILPAISLGAIQAALIARMTRASMLEVLNTDYIKMARSKGMKERTVIYSHALKNAFLPILTVIGATFGALVTGAVVTETIFNIPGIGQLIINSIERRDYTIIQGIVLFVTLIYVTINLIIDLLYGFIDPRVRLDSK
ncbi:MULTISPECIES: ABC transporter permease [Geomicrobium]|uniref:Peptide/nickel transport system permease protein n=1 Tax=Geomicrobium sediminis TaxID=1347788 RepID=A0ABS2PH31_9BACL|nr:MULTISPECIES: ABC transporter permease [Geomicrobium]MBM7634745.1 peptide/nickel transport system permease protein [Geomicrobium sediminis]GAJ98216.1 dipeptide transport system permease protein DppB [Geomicrobium sp. JCM 19055]GAK07747.1 dipeptide transport system permease protein DppB [Geomicrobium sp. JCM 19038]